MIYIQRIIPGSLFVWRNIHTKRLVLGIESTFDDSAAAVINEDGKILGESMLSQLAKHKRAGGVHPNVAQKLHEENLPIVVAGAMSESAVGFKDLSALATATRPGLSLSLQVGLDYSKKLVAQHRLPFIPVHHMEAHALTIRIIEKVDFPFLVLLASGGHCILCLARGLGDYKILGESLDEPPGAVFDKVAREMELLTDERFMQMSGGEAVEILARDGDEWKYNFTVPFGMKNNRSCNFSFSGLQTQVLKEIARLKETERLDDNACRDIAAGFQRSAFRHILNHIQRGILFCRVKDLLPPASALVLSGGVAANAYFRDNISELCDSMDMELLCPPPHLCTDNGIMIAWAGMEYLKQGMGIVESPDKVRYEARSPIGEYIGDQVVNQNIKLPKQYTKRSRGG